MSIARASIVLAQAIGTQLVTTPPNKNASSAAGKYHTEEWWIFRIAPFIFALQQPVIWTCAALELLCLLPFASVHLPAPLQPLIPTSTPDCRITPLFLLGSAAVLLGSFIRHTCFATLGKLFTFTLTIQKDHFLVTSGPYSIVRHPSYTGSLLLVFGIPIANLTSGGALIELGVVKQTGLGGVCLAVVWAAWYAWGIGCASRRCVAEDQEMRKMFGAEWEEYAKRVRWWFVPGLI